MSEANPNTTSVPTPGQLLKQNRREIGLTVKNIASHLLLSVNQVRALEADDYANLPGATYIIGYWRSYAGLLKIDASESIEFYKKKLKITSSSIAPERNHLRAHGHQEKSRKKAALLFFLLSVLFLSGIWYWQNPNDNPINQWVENLSNKQLSIRNSNTETSEKNVIEEATTFEFIPEARELPVITLPEPNFSDEFGVDKPPTSVDQENESVTISLGNQENQGQLDKVSDSMSSLEKFPAQSGVSVIANDEGKIAITTDEQILDSSQPETGTQLDTVVDLTQTNTAVVLDATEPDNVVLAAETQNSQILAITTAENSNRDADASAEIFRVDSPKWLSLFVENQTWLDVRDSNAEKLIYRTAKSGETIRLIGRPPFYVFIGAIDGVKVEYLGETVEYSSHKNGLFSRFTVGDY